MNGILLVSYASAMICTVYISTVNDFHRKFNGEYLRSVTQIYSHNDVKAPGPD